MISAYPGAGKRGERTRTDIKRDHGKLTAALDRMRLRYYPIWSEWEGVAEKSYIITGISYEDAMRLGKMFDQDAVVWQGRRSPATLYSFKEGTAIPASDVRGKTAFTVHEGESGYSKSRGISVSLDFDWNRVLNWTISKGPVKGSATLDA